jgi:hypothetical protein
MSKYKQVYEGVFQIRYNTQATSEEKCWRIINQHGDEYLVDKILIENQCETTKDWMNHLNGFKFHFTTQGILYIDEFNNAIIGN